MAHAAGSRGSSVEAVAVSSNTFRARTAGVLAHAHLPLLGAVWPWAAADLGARLFCTPAPRRRHAQDWRAHSHPPRSSMHADVAGHRLAIHTWGDPHRQPHVLLSHGWCGRGHQFAGWLHALRQSGHAVVAFDQQAHGASDGSTATLCDFVRNLVAVGRLHGRAAAVVGHAMGAAAAAIALHDGLQAERAILLAAEADPDASIQRFANRHALFGAARHGIAAALERRLGRALHDLQAHRVVPVLGHPALVVHDLGDAVVPWSEGERYARHWPGSRLLTTTGLGHFGVLHDPGVIASCLDFLRGETIGERTVSSPNLPFGVC